MEAYSAESGCPLPLRANVTTASAIATPIAEPYAAIPASAIGHLDLDIEYNDDDRFFLFFTNYHNFKKLCKYTLVKIKIKKKNSFFVLLFYSAGSGCPLPLRANVTTASAIATPTAEPYAAIPASAIKKIDLGIEYNDDDWFFLFFTKYHNFKKL